MLNSYIKNILDLKELYEIKNSLEILYSNGPIEGTNNKIKALKRTCQ